MISGKKSKDTLKQMKKKTNQPNICGVRESNPKREIHSIIGLSQKTRKNSNNLTSHLKGIEGTHLNIIKAIYDPLPASYSMGKNYKCSL